MIGNSPITIALSKGYMMQAAVQLLRQIGLQFKDDLSESRKLFTDDTTGKVRLLQVRAWDVSAYVEQGAADLGIAGKDVLLEKQEHVVQLLALPFGHCKLVIAAPQNTAINHLSHNLRIATKYPHCTERYYRSKGLKIKLIKLYGAIELAPLTGLSDVICDLTATGNTLKENQLEIRETLFESTATLIANAVSFRRRHDQIKLILNQIKNTL